jgi:hypothetical protein
MKLLKASKILHVVVLLCCFLPAIFSGCEDSPSKKEMEERAKVVQDSLDRIAATDTIQIKSADTIAPENKTDINYAIDTIRTTPTPMEGPKDTSTVKSTESGNEVLQELLNRLVFPDRENLSITGYMLLGFSSCCPILFLFMLIWAVGLRFTSKNHKLIFILTLMGFIALTIFMPDKFKDLICLNYASLMKMKKEPNLVPFSFSAIFCSVCWFL